MPRQQKTIAITLTPSQPLFFLYGLFAAFTSACLVYFPISMWMILAMMVIVWIFCIYTILLHALLRLPHSWVGLRMNTKKQWFAHNKKGDELEVMVAPDTFVSSFLTVIRLQDKRGKALSSMLLIPSRVNKSDYRQLRVMLLWGNASKKTQTDSVEALVKEI